MGPAGIIAHYRITAKIGEGGMGEVWKATDTKLNREVAIKILPEAFAQDPDRMARFAREAQVLASLNHPNIAAIYGVEDRAQVMDWLKAKPSQSASHRVPSFSRKRWPSPGKLPKRWSTHMAAASFIGISSRPILRSLPKAV